MPIDPKLIAEWRADPPGCDCTPDVDDDCACPARKAVPVLLAEREEMLALLREIEWSGRGSTGDAMCPVCEGYSHTPTDCRLAAVLTP